MDDIIKLLNKQNEFLKTQTKKIRNLTEHMKINNERARNGEEMLPYDVNVE